MNKNQYIFMNLVFQVKTKSENGYTVLPKSYDIDICKNILTLKFQIIMIYL